MHDNLNSGHTWTAFEDKTITSAGTQQTTLHTQLSAGGNPTISGGQAYIITLKTPTSAAGGGPIVSMILQ
jgi:hypothetical protein